MVKKDTAFNLCWDSIFDVNFLLGWPTRTDPTKSWKDTGKPTFLDPRELTWGGPFWKLHQKEIWQFDAHNFYYKDPF